MQENLPFKPRAQLLLQLGEQLIRNESIAMLELIKNSYDADAKKVLVSMNDIDIQDRGIITICDDGSGMDLDIIRNAWMEPGNIHKRDKVIRNSRSPLGRLPIGEKGIGRFGVHKLGKEIELVSRMKGKKEVYLYIDWNRFENANYLEDVLITINEREPEVFLNDSTGTNITIKNLSTTWTRGMLRNVYRSINTLSSPFSSNNSFKILFNTNKKEWLSGILTFDKIKDYALYYADITMENSEITNFLYEFRPYDNMVGLKKRIVNFSHERMVDKDNNEINLKQHSIGKVRIVMYVYDRTSNLVSSFINDKKTFKDYLNENGGVSVYREGMRILNYGEPDNDWLGFDIQRVNRPGVNLSNNLILGAVFLNRSESEDLKEKANREGFIENSAYDSFKNAVNYCIDRFVTYRNIDKVNLRTSLSGHTKEPITEDVSEVRKKIEKYIPNKENRKEIDVYLRRIEEDYDYIKKIYLKTASAGMSYGVVIHEIEKIIGELNKAVTIESSSVKIISLAKHLSRLVENYSELLRNRSKENASVEKIIRQSLFSVQYRLEAHNVSIIDNYSSINKFIKCSSNLVVGSLINIIDNSIWWTTYAKVQNKKILVKVTSEIDGFISIVVADNGLGFALNPEDMIKPFVSTKPGGIGLGLNIVNEIMLSQGGKLEFLNWGDVELPSEFENGAILALCFKEEINI
jgi:hypothetical protein